jgi:hypothetical protein
MKDDNMGVAYYKGEFKFGKPNGEGHMKWTDNPRMYVLNGALEYRGSFKAGKSHGEGKMLLKSGRLIKGRFDKGVCGADVCLDEFGQVSSAKTEDKKNCSTF